MKLLYFTRIYISQVWLNLHNLYICVRPLLDVTANWICNDFTLDDIVVVNFIYVHFEHQCLCVCPEGQNIHTYRRFTPWFCQLVSCPNIAIIVALNILNQYIAITWKCIFLNEYVNDKLRFKFHWNLFLWVQLAINQYWFRFGDTINIVIMNS